MKTYGVQRTVVMLAPVNESPAAQLAKVLQAGKLGYVNDQLFGGAKAQIQSAVAVPRYGYNPVRWLFRNPLYCQVKYTWFVWFDVKEKDDG